MREQMFVMARGQHEVDLALALAAKGHDASEVSRRTGVPRRTVHDWIHRGVPRRRLRPGRGCAACGQMPHNWDRLPESYVYLLGIYLGDGCISAHPRGVYRLRIFLDAGYPGIIDEVSQAIGDATPRNAVGRYDRRSAMTGASAKTIVELSSYSRAWPCLFPQHGPGLKHTRPIVLTDWQRELAGRDPRPLLRGLIHSDGCRAINTGRGGWRHPRYSFSNRSEDILGIFRWACDLLEIHHTRAPHTVYVSRKADVARMDEFVGPKA